MRLVVFFFFSVFNATFAIDLAEDQFFRNSNSEAVFLPSNKFDDNDRILNMASLKRYRLSNSTILLRVLWNPFRCALPNPKRGVVLSFLKEWNPLYQPTMSDILQNAFVFSSPLGPRKPTDMPWQRKFEVTLTSFVEGNTISEDKHLKMDLYSSGFFAIIRLSEKKVDGTIIPGVATLQFFDSYNGEVVHQTTIPLLKDIRYMSLFSRSQSNCSVFLSKVNEQFNEANRRLIIREVKDSTSHSGERNPPVGDFYKHFAIAFTILGLWLLSEVLRVQTAKKVTVDNRKTDAFSKKNIMQQGSHIE